MVCLVSGYRIVVHGMQIAQNGFVDVNVGTGGKWLDEANSHGTIYASKALFPYAWGLWTDKTTIIQVAQLNVTYNLIERHMNM